MNILKYIVEVILYSMLAALAFASLNRASEASIYNADFRKRQSVSEVTVSEVTVIKATSKMKNIKM